MSLKQKTQKMIESQRKLNKEFPKVKSWSELYNLCEAGDERYQKLCIAGLENLGGTLPKEEGTYKNKPKWRRAIAGLQDYIMALVGEYGESELDAEQSVLDEVNFVRECIDQVSLT